MNANDPEKKSPGQNLRGIKPGDIRPNEELAPLDDAVIGRAFKGSIIVAIALIAVAIALFFFLRKKTVPLVTKKTALTAPVAAPPPPVQIPEVRFSDVTAAAGIRFTHVNGAYGDKLLPETMGGGCAFIDFDNDGDQDLILVNSGVWPWKQTPGKAQPTLALYQNDGSGQFTDITAKSGLDVPFYGMGVAVGDFDNDGLADVFFTAVGGNRLFKNLGKGKFKETTIQAGVGGDSSEWSTGAAWMDVDNDGDLDLFVCHYVKWSKEIDLEVGYKLVGVGRAYGPPMNFAGTFPSLYRNNGDGTFSDISDKAGVQIKNHSTGVPTAKSMAVAPVDLNNDGWIDLVVANDTVQNFVFLNQKDGTFKEIGAVSGMAFDSYGNTRGAMGIDTGWYRNDAALGIVIANFANEMSALYVSQNQPLTFADEALNEGIGPAGRLMLKFGVFFFDYDLDGRQDMLTCNGHLEEDINKVQQSQHYKQSAQLFWNAGPERSPCFTPMTAAQSGPDLHEPIVGRGSAFADIDGDGDLDILLMQVGGVPKLLRNDQRLNHHWIRLKLIGKSANKDAIGAIVTARIAGQTLMRQVMPTRSYLSQSESVITLGLGKSDHVDELTVRWPGGQTQQVAPPTTDRLARIEQP